MQTHIETIQKEFEEDFKNCLSSATLESLKIKYLGKKGPIQDLMKGLKEASGEDRPKLGKSINDLKVSIEGKLAELGLSLIAKALVNGAFKRKLKSRPPAAVMVKSIVSKSVPCRCPLKVHSNSKLRRAAGSSIRIF